MEKRRPYGDSQKGAAKVDERAVMVIPAKFIRFGPAGGLLECNIFTQGVGRLSIAESELPRGFTATLNGCTLTIGAPPLPAGEGVRSGVVELGFASLRDDVIVVQSPTADDVPRSVNPVGLSHMAASGEPANTTGAIEVSASSPWTARIYNEEECETNPGFRFVGGTEPYAWDSERDGNIPIDIETTGANTGEYIRRGVAVFSLKKFPRYRRALMLCQEPGN